MTQSRNAGRFAGYSLADIVGVLGDAQTYKNLLYILLAFPLGMAYYVVIVTGLAVGIGLSVLLVGLGILLATVIGLRYLASFERWLTNTLLDVEILAPDDVERGDGGIIQTVKAYIQAPSTWRGLGYLVLKFWLGILSFVLLVTLLGTALELLLIPLYPDGVFNVQIGGWEIARSVGTATEQAVAVPVGAVLVLVAVHVLNAFARANGSIAASLLGADSDKTNE